MEISQEIFEKYSVKFHANPSSGSRVVPCGRTDMKKLTGAFRNFANAPKKTEIKLRSAPFIVCCANSRPTSVAHFAFISPQITVRVLALTCKPNNGQCSQTASYRRITQNCSLDRLHATTIVFRLLQIFHLFIGISSTVTGSYPELELVRLAIRIQPVQIPP